MEIAKLGEFGLIDHLTKDIKIKTAPFSLIRIRKYLSPPTC